jgi:hypothetical protein
MWTLDESSQKLKEPDWMGIHGYEQKSKNEV